jgi:catechol 2,3-dioxygenase-like lactoylglutathione lyase family enzyme
MIKVHDVAYVTYRAPDLDTMERFLADFGMVRSVRTESALYMRGTGRAHHIHVTRLAETAGFDSVAFLAKSAADLRSLSEATGAPVQPLAAPGGGDGLTLADPDGNAVQVVHGIATLDPLPIREPVRQNHIEQKSRLGETVRPPPGPAQIARLGHVLFKVRSYEATRDWYQRHLGLLLSDVLHDGPKDLVGFMRCDRGSEFTDHHTFGFAEGPVAHLHHSSFEVQDIDSQALGSEWLQKQGWRQFWGIGRHVLGSQIFDYWKDPFGQTLEHFTDGDLFDASKPAERLQIGPGTLHIWGPEPPPEFLD